ncbi:MAG: carbon-nitrogen hydrolase family protein [Kofleriaceae bacterium]
MAPAPVLVAAVQMCSTDDLVRNLATCRALAARAAAAGAQIIVLPECFAFLGSREGDKMAVAETIDPAHPGPIVETLLEIAADHRAVVVGGGMPEQVAGDSRRAYNTALVVGPGGELVARYRKIHLFDVDIPGGATLRESDATAAGSSGLVVRTHGLGLGITICYDVRFPELYRRLWRAGADVMLVPAAFTAHTGAAHWHLLLRARAVENQAYVIAAAQGGQHNPKRASFGHALGVDPWGTVVADHADGEGVIVVAVDPALIASTRRNMPCSAHAVTADEPVEVAVASA